MEFATGAMSSLIPKLGDLLLEEYNLKESVKNGIEELKKELESMQAALIKVYSVPLDQLDLQVKIWANEVREMSYAIEDSLDSFVTSVQSVEPTKHNIKHLFKMVRNEHNKFKARHEIAGDIKDIECQVRNIKERYDRYKINDIVANLESTAVDPRLSAMYNKVSDLVGTDEPIDDLMKILSEGAGMSQKDPKVVSIVGFGGLGKTTLAKALYDKVSRGYECQGFVPVGQNQGMKKVLNDIIFELDKELYKATERLDERQLINQLQEVLVGKRYFLIIDDLWDIRTWELIKCAFLDSHPESKIIITTRIFDVATSAGSIYHMKPLSDYNSKLLFYTRTCGDEELSRHNQQDEVTKKILQKCGGVPLAIITIASLLVGKPSADWSKVYDAIGFGDEDSEVTKNTRKILSFSYYDLQPYLKTCLLYLGMYPEDKFIEKKSLIWRWVSEGFVPNKQAIGSYELGENYYNDLVNKSLIREVQYNGEEGCHVHDMVLDLIRTMSMEVNFVTVQDRGENQIISSPSGQSNRVHRLALHGAKFKYDARVNMGHVRSFNAIACSNSWMPPLSIFKVLRVLVIEDCVLSEDISIKHLEKLGQLRYLGLLNTSVKLLEDIGLDLKFLEILDIRGGSIDELPPSVGELKHLRCLWADEGTRMKGEMGKPTCLEELQLYSVDKVPNFFRDVGKLTKLRVLEIWFNRLEETTGKVLAASLFNLHKIQTLVIRRNNVKVMMDLYKSELDPRIRNLREALLKLYKLQSLAMNRNDFRRMNLFQRESHVCFGGLEELTPSSMLRSFVLQSIIIPGMPSWMNALSVPLLSVLVLHVEVVEAQDLQILGRLSSLISLSFFSVNKKCVSYTLGCDEFQKLKTLFTNIEITLREGALRMLGTLAYSACARRKDSLVPWNNSCSSLDVVTCQLDCANSGRTEVKAAKAALRKAGRAHPNAKYLKLHIYIHSYNRKAAGLIDALESILAGEEITADQRELRRMITSLETLLGDNDEPQLGRYGEQELGGFVTKFKSLLHHDDSGTDQEEPDNSDTMATGDYTDTEEDTDDENHDGEDGDNDDDTEQDEADNDVAISSGGQEEGVASQP